MQLVLFVVTWLLALRSSRPSPPAVRLIVGVGLGGSVVALALAAARPSQTAVAAASIWTSLILLATVVIIVRRILSFPTVTEQSIYGAISAYLIIGLMFAAFYAALYHVHGDEFFAHGGRGHPGNTQTFQYFSFTTLSTLGYGDFTAAGTGGRAIAVLEAMTGQIFLTTLVARLVSTFRGANSATAGPPPGSRAAGPPSGEDHS